MKGCCLRSYVIVFIVSTRTMSFGPECNSTILPLANCGTFLFPINTSRPMAYIDWYSISLLFADSKGFLSRTFTNIPEYFRKYVSITVLFTLNIRNFRGKYCFNSMLMVLVKVPFVCRYYSVIFSKLFIFYLCWSFVCWQFWENTSAPAFNRTCYFVSVSVASSRQICD